MKKLLATACVLMASTLLLAACADTSDPDSGRGFANDTAGNGGAAVERTFKRSQSK